MDLSNSGCAVDSYGDERKAAHAGRLPHRIEAQATLAELDVLTI